MKKIKKIFMFLMVCLVFVTIQAMAFQDPVVPEPGGPVPMPSVVIMVASVAIVTEFLKVALAEINILVEGKGAVITAILGSVGVVGYHWIMSGTDFSFLLITTLGQVIIGATMGFKLLKMAGGRYTLKNLAGKVIKEMK